MTPTASPSTTKGRGTRSGSSPSVSRRRLVTCGEYLAFIADGGYRRAELWLSDGWATVQQQGWAGAALLAREDGGWTVFTLAGRAPARSGASPSCMSASTRRTLSRAGPANGCRREAEWEVAALEHDVALAGNLARPRGLSPRTGVAGRDCCRWSATFGNGPPAPISPIRATVRSPAPSASTTASSCRARWCCGAAQP